LWLDYGWQFENWGGICELVRTWPPSAIHASWRASNLSWNPEPPSVGKPVHVQITPPESTTVNVPPKDWHVARPANCGLLMFVPELLFEPVLVFVPVLLFVPVLVFVADCCCCSCWEFDPIFVPELLSVFDTSLVFVPSLCTDTWLWLSLLDEFELTGSDAVVLRGPAAGTYS